MDITNIDLVYSFILGYVAILKIPIPPSILNTLNTRTKVANYRFWATVTRFLTVELGFLSGNSILNYTLWQFLLKSNLISNKVSLGIAKITLITILYWISFLIIKYKATPEDEDRIVDNYLNGSDLPDLMVSGTNKIAFTNYFKTIMAKPFLISMVYNALSLVVGIITYFIVWRYRIY